jgi:hypothetical protein
LLTADLDRDDLRQVREPLMDGLDRAVSGAPAGARCGRGGVQLEELR